MILSDEHGCHRTVVICRSGQNPPASGGLCLSLVVFTKKKPMSVSHAPEDVDDDHWTVDQRHIEKLQERYKNEEFPLFMDSVPREFTPVAPKNAAYASACFRYSDDAQGNPHLQALQHIMFEEQTPEERALSYKVKTNSRALLLKKRCLRL